MRTIALILSMFLCASAQATTAVLSVCTEASPDGFDVVRFNSLSTTNAVADTLMNRLVEWNSESGEIQPSLAQSWTVDDSGTRYEFTLRDNVAFHRTGYFQPSRSLNADDVLFSFQRMLDENHPWHATAPNGYPHAQSMRLAERISAVERVDDRRVRFILRESDATFLPMLSMGFASIYSAEYAEQLRQDGSMEKLNTAPIGTGPFIFKRYQKDAVIRYMANPKYFLGAPTIKVLIFAITPDANVRLQKLRRNECQIALSPKPMDVVSAQTDETLKVAQTPAFMTAFVALNTQRPPLDRFEVRQAINLAFDKPTYVKAVFENSAIPADSIYPPATWAYDSQLPVYAFDQDRARALLDQVGLSDGFDITIWTRPNGSLLNPNPALGAQLLQEDLARIGIRATIRVMEWGELIRRAKAGEHDLLFMGWAGDDGDPDNFLTPLFSCAAVKTGLNFARYCDASLDASIEEGRHLSDRNERAERYRQAQQRIHDLALWLPLAHPTATVLLRQSVEGYRANPFGRQDFYTVH